MTQHPSTSIAMFEKYTTEQLREIERTNDLGGRYSSELSNEITRRERDVSPHVTTITLVRARITYRLSSDNRRAFSQDVTHYTKRDCLAVLAESEHFDVDDIERITFSEMKINELDAHLFISA